MSESEFMTKISSSLVKMSLFLLVSFVGRDYRLNLGLKASFDGSEFRRILFVIWA